jgi:hypothetical protein
MKQRMRTENKSKPYSTFELSSREQKAIELLFKKMISKQDPNRTFISPICLIHVAIMIQFSRASDPRVPPATYYHHLAGRGASAQNKDGIPIPVTKARASASTCPSHSHLQ